MNKIEFILKEKSGVYMIINLRNGKRYIGSSKDIYNRLHEHLHNLVNNKAHNRHLQSAWNKYGEDNFIWTVLEFCDEQIRFEREQYFITCFSPEYNKSDNVIANIGCSPSEETRLKISNTLKQGYKEGRILGYKNEDKKTITYIYNIKNWNLETVCSGINEAYRYLGTKSSGSNDFSTRIYQNTFILCKEKFNTVEELQNYVIPNYLYYKSNKPGVKKFLVVANENGLKYYSSLTECAKDNMESRSTLSKHTNATLEYPYKLKSGKLMYFTEDYTPLESVTILEKSGNIGENPIMENTEINSEITKGSESSYSVEGE